MQRNTVQRRIILQTVLGMHNHPTAADVYAAVSESCPGIGRATVYRVLGQLAEEGLIRRVPMSDGADRYDFTLKEHGHFICTGCGKVCDFPLESEKGALNSYVSLPDSYRIYKINVTAEGLCPECSGKAEKPTAND